MKIAIGADWVGYPHKKALVEYLQKLGHEVLDVGAHSADMNDYPDYAEMVGLRVTEKQVDCGVLVCATGIGCLLLPIRSRG
jgi:ribose 5-phosphate isomerase B